MKGKVFLVHWNRQESDILADMVRSYGWEVAVESEDGARAARLIKLQKPDAIVIFLTRQPSHGRETGSAIRSAKATQSIPIIWVDGAEEVIGRTKQAMPDAIFTNPENLREALSKLAHY